MTPVETTAAKGKLNPETGSTLEENTKNEVLDKFDENSIVIVPVNDESKKLRQILSNETSMKILDLLRAESLSASEVADKLNLPLTTVKYNIDQMVEYELVYIQRIKYSEKGRQVKIYEAQEKVIIFAPEKVSRISLAKMLQKYAFAFMAAAFAGFGLNYIYQQYLNNSYEGRSAIEPAVFTAGDETGELLPALPVNTTTAIEEVMDTGAGTSFFHDIIISINDWFFGLLTYHSFWFIAGALFVCAVIWVIEFASVKKEKSN